MHFRLAEIETKWSRIKKFKTKKRFQALAGFLADEYFAALADKFRHYQSDLTPLQAEEMASDVLFELIDNDYRYLNELSSERGRLRGLFYKMIRQRLSKLGRDREYTNCDIPEGSTEVHSHLDIRQDIRAAIARLAKDNRDLAEAIEEVYFGGKTVEETATTLEVNINTLKKRLVKARSELAEHLEGYQPDS